MRYDTPVTLVLEQGEVYNEATGNYDPGELKETKVYANVSDTVAEFANLLYGKIKNNAYTIIMQGTPPHAVSYILMDDKKYTIDRTRSIPKNNPRTTTYFVSGGT